MKIDTTKITTTTINTAKAKTFIEKTTVIETTKNEVDYFSKSFDFFGSIAWQVLILILILFFKEKIKDFITILIDKIKTSEKLNFSRDGISLYSSEVKTNTPIVIEENNASPDPDIKNFDEMSKNILSTLWNEQLSHDDTFNKRFTFTLRSDDFEYHEFEKASKILRFAGLITIALNNGQLFLTDFGIKYCRENGTELGNFSFFKN